MNGDFQKYKKMRAKSVTSTNENFDKYFPLPDDRDNYIRYRNTLCSTSNGKMLNRDKHFLKVTIPMFL